MCTKQKMRVAFIHSVFQNLTLFVFRVMDFHRNVWKLTLLCQAAFEMAPDDPPLRLGLKDCGFLLGHSLTPS